ncbi:MULTISPECIES: hypothetical protein [unclassified Sphingosinithalassobacter]|uniref:hypothetical protein n=1 Tax=unclassified Sphingosinithalassobacter TaxID=2676235 RepID=UPI00165D74F0|nr:hypothetical protein [Sphingosinithalassobacter sp. CS137]
MQTMRLENGVDVEVQLLPAKGDGYMIVHSKAGAQRAGGRVVKTITCCCGGKCVSTTCEYDEGEVPSPHCDCSDPEYPGVSC